MDDLPRLTTRTFVGIVVAISGNVLISLALNLQKLAHKRVEKMRLDASRSAQRHDTSLTELDEDDEEQSMQASAEEEDVFLDRPPATVDAELRPLTSHPEPLIRNYGGSGSSTPTPNGRRDDVKRSFISRLNPLRTRQKLAQVKYTLPVDIMSEDAALHGLASRNHKKHDTKDNVLDENEGEYLKSKLWWLGFLLMNVGEMGNFISYAFAPASLVAPLGTFALMANCFFAPLLLGEYFRKRDLLGVAIAIIGAVTVVLASNASDTRLNPDALLHAISQTSFVIYTCTYIIGAIVLAMLSEGNIGKSWVFVDVGLCALFGGFTVLSTKALSTLLTLEWIDLFRRWITYPLIAVLVLTGVGQIRYLNRALMRFDSKVVIPIQFVLFTLSAIIGSAILYGDFRKAKFHQIVTFLYGCAATFAGVFIIAWDPKDTIDTAQDDEIGRGELDSTSNTSQQAISEGAHLGMGILGRRNRATLVLPSGLTPRDTPAVRRKRSTVGMMGISPAQHLLLVHTPPREAPLRSRLDADNDAERGVPHSPEYVGRRRTMSWYGNDGGRGSSGLGTRNNSVNGRLRDGTNPVGSYDERFATGNQ
ncbi:DUF803-domain-containing protein [Agrocybe pediades]|nr:DUF803-domain-containing protein [Agrocybe pediades]